MRAARAIALILAAGAALLGGLWLLQGLGLVQVRPILCATACEEVRGASLTWSIAGATLILASLATAAVVLRRWR